MRRRSMIMVGGLAAALGCGGDAGSDLQRRSAFVPPPVGVGTPDAGGTDAGRQPGAPDPDPPAPPPFDEPGCPPASPPPDLTECDPLASPSGCPFGQSCFPSVFYPTDECGVEVFFTRCLPAGPGTQGESCAMQACAADHICVSTGRGTQCVRLCGFSANASSVCAPGLLCLPIDIQGFGGCL